MRDSGEKKMTFEEYKALSKEIDYHMNLYYNDDAPEISDYEYDMLMQKLKAAEAEHPEWVTPDSPSQKIGGVAKREAGVKVTHNVPMLSIEDVFNEEDVVAWVNKVLERHPDASFSVEQKIDGLSMTLRYTRMDDGRLHLTLAETRGDGLVGEDVTANAHVIPDVQKELDLDFEYLEVRGEVYMSHEDFEKFNEEQERLGKKTSANPRNLAAGTLRQLDTSITKNRGLNMFVFNIQDGPAEVMESHDAGLKIIEQAGIKTVYHKLCSNAEEVVSAIREIGEMRSELPFDIDGAVVKVDHIAYRNDFPAGSKYSAGHIAFKYPPEERPVVMEEIEETVGRTGKLAFIGHVLDAETHKPARLCGTNVSRVTLHNADYMLKNRIGIGGVYKLKKSGDIIPKICGVVTEPEKLYQVSEFCPVCGAKLVVEEDTADIRCVNPTCKAQLSRTISYFTSLNCMNIMGLGETLVDALLEEGYLSSYADIYHLKEHRDELVEKGIIGREKNTDKLLAAIEASKENEADRFLAALGIRNVGRRTASTIMKEMKTIDAVRGASVERLQEISDVGETTAVSIYDFFHDERNIEILEDFKALGLNMEMEEKDNASDKLAGLTFVITGTLPNYGRKEMQALVEDNGGKCTGSVSKKTSYLIAGEAAGSKLDKANALGIPVLDEAAFLEMLK
jgi:DNA ligase (NAD+)